MTKAVLGIIGGSGIYDLPGLEDIHDDVIATPWGEPSAPLKRGMLAGLPIVTTPSVGGRDVYFDPDYCLTVAPEPDAVAAAVQALRARRIPRSHIRARTLQRIEADRRRFQGFLNRLLAEAGSRRRLDGAWPFRKPVTMEWNPVQEAVDRAVHGVVDAFHPDDWLPSWLWRRRTLHGMRWLRKTFRL